MVRAARYIGQGFIITLSYENRLLVTIQYPFQIYSHPSVSVVESTFNLTKAFFCEVCVRVCPMDQPVVVCKLETNIRKKRLLNYSIDFGICISCGNCIEIVYQ
ncbi:putative NADH-plastoquinone oxidoreductase, subunit I, alpha-helical ferredoxin [Helianthus annuus]|nr:putative NADH-plastoquinone oxidoreductase, subunit I, alpha-helical ferredoxin [Helianthus annuus]